MTLHLMLLAAAEGAAGEHAEAKLLGLGAEGWVYTGITIFFLVAIFGVRAHRSVLSALDSQIAETRKSLDEAKAIRTEAEALLVSAKAQQAASAEDAKGIIAHAQHEAQAIIAKAETDTAELVVRREKMAQDKIAAAERAAVEALRNRTSAAATAAARTLIAAQHDATADKPLVDQAIDGI